MAQPLLSLRRSGLLLSCNREFDFVRLDGLRRATGRPPHEWDIYIIKELLDNALDADEMLWQQDYNQHPAISIIIEYIPDSERQSQQFVVEVNNRAVFPTEQINDIFNTGWYTSRKAFIKGVTRGALGNALKTLLGIPYVLRNRLLADDWKPDRNPMFIRCGTTEYRPQYVVDSLDQQVQFVCSADQRKAVNGTVISVAVDHFKQEQPRTLEDIKALALQYHLCNPHASISWTVAIDEDEWEEVYHPVPGWTNKFHGVAPIHWYSFTAFQDVLGALHRKLYENEQGGQIPLDEIYRCFLSSSAVDALKSKSLPGASLAISEIEDNAGLHLYHTLSQQTPRFDASSLGAIGSEHVVALFKQTFAIEGGIF